MVLLPMKKEITKIMLSITFFVKGLLKMKRALKSQGLRFLKSFRLTRLLLIFSSILLASSIMISSVVLPSAILSTRIPTAKSYYNDYPVDVTRVTLNTQYSFASGSSGEWRQHTFQFTVNQPYYPTYTLSFTANSQYGDNYLKWVSIYDADYRLVYSSGWVDTIDNVVVPSPFQEGENSGTVHVYERVMRKDHTAPPQNEMNSTMFVFRGQYRDVVTQPQGWNETTTATYTTATQFIPDLTTGTSVTIAATPQRLINHERFFLAVLDKLWELPDIMWLTVACLVLVFCAWLLL